MRGWRRSKRRGAAHGPGRGRRRRVAAALLAALTTLAAGALPRPSAGCEGPRGDRDPSSLRLGVVFAGGGAKGAYEAGVALALEERGVTPAAAAGTSSGAFNAVLLANGEAGRLAGLWRTVRRQDVFEYRAPTVFGGLLPAWVAVRVLARTRGLLDPSPLRRTLARHVDLERLRASPVAVLVLATDLVSGAVQRFDNETLTLDALVASATVPGIFPPVVADGRLLVDGGVVQRAPVLELLAMHPLDRLLVVAAYESGPPRAATLQPVVERAVELALSREILRDVELARLRHRGVDVRLLRPSAPLAVRPLDFDGARLAALVALGQRDAARCLDALGYRG